MKILLTYVSEIENKDCKHYVYNLIKKFAIKNNEIYISSNLLDLMNRIYQEKRGIFVYRNNFFNLIGSIFVEN